MALVHAARHRLGAVDDAFSEGSVRTCATVPRSRLQIVGDGE
jgi:hypothetical protein